MWVIMWQMWSTKYCAITVCGLMIGVLWCMSINDLVPKTWFRCKGINRRIVKCVLLLHYVDIQHYAVFIRLTHWPLGDVVVVLKVFSPDMLCIYFMRNSSEMPLRWMLQNIFDDNLTLRDWWHQAKSHYLGRFWPISISSYGATVPQWVHSYWVLKPQCIIKSHIRTSVPNLCLSLFS